jgi:hypothetical protein
MELYEVALHMLLERRDNERRIETAVKLDRTSRTLILRDLAYWLLRNDWSAAPAARVIERIGVKLESMPQVLAPADQVYKTLLERSGLLREAVEGQTDFVHRTFQEYLAAAELIAQNDLGVLFANAHRDLWSEVVVMAAGHASVSARAELLRGLLHGASAQSDPEKRDSLRLLAIACLETSPEVPRELHSEIMNTAELMLPPHTMGQARSLAKAGSFVLDLLAQAKPVTVAETTATIRALAEMGNPDSLPALARFSNDSRKLVAKELLRSWPNFEPGDYARVVLNNVVKRHFPTLEVADPDLAMGLPQLTNARSVYCTYLNSSIQLDFLPAMPQLKELTTLDRSVSTLEPVAKSNLRKLSMNAASVAPSLSLAPLEQSLSLESLRIYSSKTIDEEAVGDLTQLRQLWLLSLSSLDALDGLSRLAHLNSFGIGHPDLTDLAMISFLRAPADICLSASPVERQLEFLTRWSESLHSLSLRDMLEPVNLNQIEGLHNLESLDVQGTHATNLTALVGAEKFHQLWTTADLVDLEEVAALKSLKSLYLSGVPNPTPIDLRPLAGRNHLIIRHVPGILFENADVLGFGSKVQH